MNNYFELLDKKYYIHKDVISRFGILGLFLAHETQTLPDYNDNNARGLTKSPWLIIDDNNIDNPKQERFYYYLWSTIFGD